jgi:Zn-finger nucleic acid-binding protein
MNEVTFSKYIKCLKCKGTWLLRKTNNLVVRRTRAPVLLAYLRRVKMEDVTVACVGVVVLQQ